MFRTTVSYGGTLLVAAALVFLTADSGYAAPRGGGGGHGGGGGGHGGGFSGGHSGGFHSGGHSGGFHDGFHGGHNFRPYFGGYNYGYYPNYYNTYPNYSSDYSSGYDPGYSDSYYLPPVYAPDSTTDDVTPPKTDAAAHLIVSVPADAQLWFDGTATDSSGTIREFDTPPLKPDRRYSYEIRAQWTKDGHEVTQTQKVGVTAGTPLNVTFPLPATTLGEPKAAK